MTRSTQTVLSLRDGAVISLELPGPLERVGRRKLRWGSAEVPLTPAYWASQAWMWGNDEPDHFRLGRSLTEEMLACILGGYGIPAEVGLAAFERLRSAYASVGSALEDPAVVEQLLLEPLTVGGRSIRYRFARQKADYVAAALRQIDEIDDSLADRALRDRIMLIRGFGPKTASWVVRNWRRSDDVAILDIHILRVGASLGLFDEAWRVDRHYADIEAAYLEFARDLGVRASLLDSVMWMTVRQFPNAKKAVPSVVASRPRARQPELAL